MYAHKGDPIVAATNNSTARSETASARRRAPGRLAGTGSAGRTTATSRCSSRDLTLTSTTAMFRALRSRQR